MWRIWKKARETGALRRERWGWETRKGMLNLTFYLYLNNKRDHTRNNRFAAFPSFYEDHFAGVYGIFCLERTVILVKEKWNQPQTSKKTTKENSKHIWEGGCLMSQEENKWIQFSCFLKLYGRNTENGQHCPSTAGDLHDTRERRTKVQENRGHPWLIASDQLWCAYSL